MRTIIALIMAAVLTYCLWPVIVALAVYSVIAPFVFAAFLGVYALIMNIGKGK